MGKQNILLVDQETDFLEWAKNLLEATGTRVLTETSADGAYKSFCMENPELVMQLKLLYKDGRRWADIRSPDINRYVKKASGGDFSAKDFRTWSATVLAAVALAVSGPAVKTNTSRKRAKSRAIKEVARYLGNTPAVCRASYIDPRVFDRFDGGLTIGGVLPELLEDTGPWPDVQGAVEEAVLDLIAGDRGAEGVERARALEAVA